MGDRIVSYGVPIGSFLLSVAMSMLVGTGTGAANVRKAAQQTGPGAPDHTLKVPRHDNSDENGLARGTAQVKPSSAGTVDKIVVNSIALTITANDGTSTTEDVTQSHNLTTSGLTTDLASYRIDMTSTWNDLGGALLVGGNIKEVTCSFKVTAEFTVNGAPASIPKEGTCVIKIKTK